MSEPTTANTSIEPMHSGYGITSFILSILSGIIFLILVITSFAIEQTTVGGTSEEAATVILFFMVFIFIMLLISISLGIAGLVQKNRQKTFPILGTIFSSITLLSFILITSISLLTI